MRHYVCVQIWLPITRSIQRIAVCIYILVEFVGQGWNGGIPGEAPDSAKWHVWTCWHVSYCHFSGRPRGHGSCVRPLIGAKQ